MPSSPALLPCEVHHTFDQVLARARQLKQTLVGLLSPVSMVRSSGMPKNAERHTRACSLTFCCWDQARGSMGEGMGPQGLEGGHLDSLLLAVLPHPPAMLCSSRHTAIRTWRGQDGVQQQQPPAGGFKGSFRAAWWSLWAWCYFCAPRHGARAIMGMGPVVRWWPWWRTRWTSAWSWKSAFSPQMGAETLPTARAHAEEVTVGFRAIFQIFE